MTRILGITSALVLTSVAYAETQESKQEGEKADKGERAMQVVYFDFDSATPSADLLMVANELECTPDETIILDAHTDPVGTNAYNADLAKRRAEAVRDRLVEYGIDEDRIVLGVFGEEAEERASHQLDRRVEIRTSDEPLTAIVEKRQGTAVAILTAEGEQVEEVARP
jgi:outer membrane protein OmpA-like peptidoglycan-associated protein